MNPTIFATCAPLLAGVTAAGVVHAYRYYRWVAYGEPMP